MTSGQSGGRFGRRVGWRVALFLAAMFGFPLTLYALDRFAGNDDVTIREVVRLATGTWLGFCLYLAFTVSMIRPCWLRIGAIGLPRYFGLIVPLLMLLDTPFFVAVRGATFGISLGSAGGNAPIYLITALGLAMAMMFACPLSAASSPLQSRLGFAMLGVVIVVLAEFVFSVGMAKWTDVLTRTLASHEALPRAFFALTLASYWLMWSNPLLCAALVGLAGWWAVLSRRLTRDRLERRGEVAAWSCGYAYPTFSANQILISDWYGTSRLLAAILICSSRPIGSRSEIAVVDGFRLGKRTRWALLQSM